MPELIGKRLLATIAPSDKAYEIRDSRLPGFLLRVYPSGKIVYICQYARGKRITIGTASADLPPADARDKALEILAKYRQDKTKKPSAVLLSTITMGQFLDDEYTDWAVSNRKSGDITCRRIKTRFKEFSNKALQDITPWVVEKWRSKRLKDGKKVSTVNRDIAALKAMFSKAKDWGFIDENPLSTIKLGKTDSRSVVRYLSSQEEARLRDALDRRELEAQEARRRGNQWRKARNQALLPEITGFSDHLKPMVILAMNTGLRRGELFSLRWSDIRFTDKVLTVRGDTAKSGQTRHVPLNDEALEVLTHWQRDKVDNLDAFVFPSNGGGRLDNIKKAWGKLLIDAEIENFRFHDLRHHFASRLVMAGVALNTVRDLLGHSDIHMTLRYAHLNPEHKAEAVSLLLHARAGSESV